MSTNTGAVTRTPPRFVPTLTEVIQVSDGLLPTEAAAGSGLASEPSRALPDEPAPAVPNAQSHPVRAEALLWSDVPPLPQHPLVDRQTVASAQATQTWPTPDLMEALGVLITEQVMQRLEQRLAALVDQHASHLVDQLARNLTEALSQQLQAEVPELVQQAMALAVDPTGSGPVGFEHQRGFSPIYGADGDPG